MRNFSEVKNDYTDEEVNMTMIDAYKSDDENEQGKTIAAVCRDTGKVIFFDNRFRGDNGLKESIAEVLAEIKKEASQNFRGKYFDYSCSLYCKK